jgi:hypothetical protein
MEANDGVRHRKEELKPGLIIFRRGDALGHFEMDGRSVMD